ncbi:MAG: AAA family ATPase, partial [Acidobacteriota bacterium]|nr:AAA family ATPase [Acidobacteriota bacterium]
MKVRTGAISASSCRCGSDLLEEIVLRGFRNLADVSWHPNGDRHLLVGPNGAGKTSLLEAIYFLATTRSFRTSALADCRRHGEVAFSVAGRVEREGRFDLVAGLNERGVHRELNGKESRLANYLAALPVVS